MTAQTQSNDAALGRLRTLRGVAIAAAALAYMVLVVAFGVAWKAYYQVGAGLLAYVAIEWQRHYSRKIRELDTGAASR